MATVIESPRSYVVGRLSPHQVTAVRSRLAECERSKRGDRAGAERRQDVRIAIDEPARMKVLQPLGCATEIRVLDVSRSGLKISIPEMLAPGTIIQIHMKAAIAFAEVRYTSQCGDDLHAGVRFQDVFWTPSVK
jgi:hypothetical protein